MPTNSRMYVIRERSIRNRNLSVTYLTVFMCFLISFIWSILPMMGWSSYKREGLMANCNIDWHEKSLNNLSYFIVVWTLDFIVPLICIFVFLIKSLFLVKYFLKHTGISRFLYPLPSLKSFFFVTAMSQ
jgi:hypothetical protein